MSVLSDWVPRHRQWAALPWPDLQNLPHREHIPILQPIGAIEQHGPHLPLLVDSAIALAVVGRALTLLEDEIPAYCLPPLYYGKSTEHEGFPGTISLRTETLIHLLMDVGESVYRSGFRKWVLVNAHGGQPQVLEMVARDLHRRYPDFWVFPLFVWRVLAQPERWLPPREITEGIHAGDAETSLLLHWYPELVRMERAAPVYLPPADSCLSLEGALPWAWVTQDVSASGVLGDPTTATAAKGAEIWQALAEGWVQVIRDVHRFGPPSP